MHTELRKTFLHTWTQTAIRQMGYRTRLGRAVRIPYTFELKVRSPSFHRRVYPYQGLLPFSLRQVRLPTLAASLDVEVQRASMTQFYLHLD
ncbi:MAG: hypothetical protein ABIK09_09625 [Pseudomonadota bacterium]